MSNAYSPWRPVLKLPLKLQNGALLEGAQENELVLGFWPLYISVLHSHLGGHYMAKTPLINLGA